LGFLAIPIILLKKPINFFRRDIARTYPEHEFFKKKDGFGQVRPSHYFLLLIFLAL
jgi:hypothetical protein